MSDKDLYPQYIKNSQNTETYNPIFKIGKRFQDASPKKIHRWHKKTFSTSLINHQGTLN